MRSLLIAVVCFYAGADAMTQTPRVAYANARAEVRADAREAAAIVGYLPINTRVERRMTTIDWCGIRAGALSGFVSCRLLSQEPLTESIVSTWLNTEDLSARDRFEWTSRAFWLDPSLARFQAVGEAMDSALLSAYQRAQERQAGNVSRRPNAAFDAMKARLRNPVVPPTHASLPRLPPVTEGYASHAPVDEARRRVALPPVRTSFFRDGEPLLVVPLRPLLLIHSDLIATSLVDALSVTNQVSFRTRVSSPAYAGHFGTAGAWDVGSVAATFATPVTLQGVTARGEHTKIAITAVEAKIGQHACADTWMRLISKPLDARWRNAIVGWAGKPAPPAPASVVTSVAGGKSRYERVTVETIDLDLDGQADLLTLTGIAPPAATSESTWKAAFANVEGRWVLVAYADVRDCS